MNSKPSKKLQERYKRQTGLLGKSGQEALKNSSAAIVGLGGLGSPAATYLALAGMGKLVLVDHDEVTPSNLNRQFLHWDEDLTRKKTSSAREKLKKINSDLSVESLELKLTPDSIGALPEVDLLVGSVDNFRARFLLNELAIERDIPYIHGAVEGLRGQLTTIIPGDTPCLRCIFPDDPPNKTGIPILGTTAGLIGTMMASEAIKYITNKGELLKGNLLLVDLGFNEFEFVAVHKNPGCQTCRS